MMPVGPGDGDGGDERGGGEVERQSGQPPASVPVMTPDATPELELPPSLAILPSLDAVLYPGMLLPLQVGDPRWVRLLSDAVSARQPIGLVLQRNPQEQQVTDLQQLYSIGTAAIIVRLLKLPDGSLQVLLQGAARIRLKAITQAEPYLRGQAEVLPASGDMRPTDRAPDGAGGEAARTEGEAAADGERDRAPKRAGKEAERGGDTATGRGSERAGSDRAAADTQDAEHRAGKAAAERGDDRAAAGDGTERPSGVELEGLVRNLQSLFQRMVQLSPVLPGEMAIAVNNMDEPGRLADFVAANCDLDPPQRQEILEELDAIARARRVTELVTRELEVMEIGSRIQSQIRETMDKQQREFYLRQQLAAIRKELGETDEAETTLATLKQRLEDAGLPAEAKKEADRELNRLSSIPSASPEHSMVRTYVEWLADLPWSAVTADNLELAHAKRVLDEDHHDLNRVKDRILEFLAVMKLRADAGAARADGAEGDRIVGSGSASAVEAVGADGDRTVGAGSSSGSQAGVADSDRERTDGSARNPEPTTTRSTGSLRGPILCLVGPPGVGKTSLGQSIARALGRKFVRMSLGGVRDEAEVRGHRRTYIGAMPGRIIQGLRRAGSKNPVFILDELDKLGADWRGDPSSALLEVLDPAQNSDFRDHYLDVPFDLSSVLFIATANMLDTIPPALRDRLEVIDLPGYTEDDKLQIAKRFLVPRQLTENGLDDKGVKISDLALRRIIREYTREAGVRNLEREIATVARKAARAIVMGETRSVDVSSRKIREMLGPARFQPEVAEREDEVGVATGLAFTPVGGEVLFVEARAVPGKGSLVLTGQLGDVMKESAQAAMTYARSRADALGLKTDDDPFAEIDVHVHVPAGAVPKDGPSAGITMATAIISAVTRRPVDHTVGMTGEITLRGRVMPIGGLKEKVLAAHRAGLRRVIVPRDNRKDLEEIPQRVRRQIAFTFVDHMDQVLNVALKREVRQERAQVKRVTRRSRDKVPAAASAP